MSLFIPLANKDQPVPVPTVKRDDDVTRFARLAIVIGVMLSLAFTMLVFACVLWGWVGEWRFGVGLWLSLLALAWMLAAGFGAWWTFVYKVRRPAKFEDDERKARKPQTITETVQVPTSSGELLELFGWRALAYQLMQEHDNDLTREYAEKHLHIPQRAYNKLNMVFVAMGIKTDKAWYTHEDMLPMLLYDRVTFDPDGSGAWVDRRHLIFKD